MTIQCWLDVGVIVVLGVFIMLLIMWRPWNRDVAKALGILWRMYCVRGSVARAERQFVLRVLGDKFRDPDVGWKLCHQCGKQSGRRAYYVIPFVAKGAPCPAWCQECCEADDALSA